MQVSILPLLGILFIALKLTHVITWCWVLVLLPFWIGAAVFLTFLILALVGAGVVAATKTTATRCGLPRRR